MSKSGLPTVTRQLNYSLDRIIIYGTPVLDLRVQQWLHDRDAIPPPNCTSQSESAVLWSPNQGYIFSYTHIGISLTRRGISCLSWAGDRYLWACQSAMIKWSDALQETSQRRFHMWLENANPYPPPHNPFLEKGKENGKLDNEALHFEFMEASDGYHWTLFLSKSKPHYSYQASGARCVEKKQKKTAKNECKSWLDILAASKVVETWGE